MKKICISLILLLLLQIESVYAISPNRSNTSYVKNTPPSRIFTLENDSYKREFVLLDELEDGYLVIMKNFAHEKMPFDKDNTGKFDIEDENNIAYWLNHDFLEKDLEGVTQLPKEIASHLVEREWTTEGGNSNSGFTKAYKTMCKIVIMSQTEWNTYCSTKKVLGTYDDKSNVYWLLRTTDSTTIQSGEYASGILCCQGSNGTTVYGKAVSGAGVRPMFVLDKDFFKDESVSITASGSEVLMLMKKQMSVSELAEKYNNNDIDNLINWHIFPDAKNIVCEGIPIVGRILNGDYQYYCADNKPENGTIVRWLRSNSIDGYYSPIKGANTLEYALTEADAGKYIKFEVISQTKINVGYPVSSEPILISDDSVPEIYDVSLLGRYSGEEFYPDFHYRDEKLEPAANYYFNWQISDDNVNYIDIPEADEITYLPSHNLCGKYIKVGVCADKLGDGSYPRGEFSYSEPVLIEGKPVVSNLRTNVGTTASVSYSYSDYRNIAEGMSDISWEISDKENGIFLQIKKGNDISLPVSNQGYWLRCSVTPINAEGNVGEKVSSSPIFVSGNGETTSQCDVLCSNEAGKTKLIMNSPRVCRGMIVEIQSINDISQINSEHFDVEVFKNGNRYICMLNPKNSEGVYAYGEILDIKTNTTMEVLKVTLLTDEYFELTVSK